jgi:hypothetical protein
MPPVLRLDPEAPVNRFAWILEAAKQVRAERDGAIQAHKVIRKVKEKRDNTPLVSE